VAIFGGKTASGEATATVELFDPADGLFADAPPMTLSRIFHTATALSNSGEVLVVGGMGDAANSYEVWSPEEGGSSLRLLQESRWHHSATRLGSGSGATAFMVAIAGGQAPEGEQPMVRSSMEIYDSRTEALTDLVPLCTQSGARPLSPSRMTLHSGFFWEAAGFHLLLGGYIDAEHLDASSGVCALDVGALAWVGDNSEIEVLAARGHAASTSAHGIHIDGILVTGGLDPGEDYSAIPTAEYLHFSADGTSSHLPGFKPVSTPLLVPRWDHDAVTTCDGRVLIVGGLTGPSVDEASVTAVTEVFNP